MSPKYAPIAYPIVVKDLCCFAVVYKLTLSLVAGI